MSSERKPQRGRGRLATAAKKKKVSVLDVVKEAIQSAGSIHRAAEVLKVAPTTLRYHLKKAGLEVVQVVVIEFRPVESRH